MAGEFVVKKENAGFCQERLILYIPKLEDFKKYGFDYSAANEDEENCVMCDDPHCREYANLLVVKENVISEEWIYHVSECMMDDYKKE